MISNDQLNEFRRMAGEGDVDVLRNIIGELVEECQAYAVLVGGLVEFKNKRDFEELRQVAGESRALLEKLVEAVGQSKP